ncbi:hypothetical protein [Proteus phage PM2]|uniref:Uncharacterized protein n=1 Tax=Proteus phage PM2 TaxID=2025809 RepID=A0A249XXY4_9CAUD|nr:hypothetical protein KNT71_gp060 [Proteus phage PM2]ASZ76346.1 hypothetical protein [Proteus phage PM2]
MHFYLTDCLHKNLDVKVSTNELGYVLHQGNDCVCLSNDQLDRLIKERQIDLQRKMNK